MSDRAVAAPAAGRAFGDWIASRRERPVRPEPAWLRDRRTTAARSFDARGLPTPHDEDWRQTTVAPIAETAFGDRPQTSVAPSRLDALRLAGGTGPRIVLVDGVFSPELSRLDRFPEGVSASGLGAAIVDSPALLESYLGLVAAVEDHPFAAINTLLFEDGLLLRASARAAIDEPIEVLHVATGGPSPYVVNARLLVVAEAESRLPVVESFLALDGGVYLTNAVTEIVVGENASVEHTRIQDEAKEAFHVGRLQSLLDRCGRFVSHNVSLGAALARYDLGSRLDGEGAECHLYGLSLADGRQHVDNHTCLEHAKPHCPSWELYKGILGGSATSVFNGRIVVLPDAQKTDAKQSNRNLLLSRDAVVHTRPQLEIRANDVKCTHGATIGRLDEEALFYLRARGVGSDEARGLLLHAFAAETLEKIGNAELRARIEEAMTERLPRPSVG